MVYSNTNDNDEIEVDGIFFKTLMPERVVTIPPKQSDARTAVRFGIQITNSQANSQCFLLFFMRPEFFQLDRQKVFGSGPNANKLCLPELADFQLLMPGESVIFLLQGYFQWDKNELWFSFRQKDGSYWSFYQFTQNSYLMGCVYRNGFLAWEQRGSGSGEDFIYFKPVWENPNHNNPRSDIIKMKNVWMGEVNTPPIEFSLI